MRWLKGRLLNILAILFIPGILVWSFLEYTYVLSHNVENTVNSILSECWDLAPADGFYELNQAYAELTAAASSLVGKEPTAAALSGLRESGGLKIRPQTLDLVRPDGISVSEGGKNYAGEAFFQKALGGASDISTRTSDGQKQTLLAIPIGAGDDVSGILLAAYRFERISDLIAEQYGAITKATAILTVKLLAVFLLVGAYVWFILRKKAAVLERQKKELDTLTSNIPGGVRCCRNDIFLSIHYLSDGFLYMTGFTRDDITLNFNDQYIRMIYPKDRAAVLSALKASESTYELRYRIIRKDGTVRWLLDKGQLVTEKEDIRLYSVLIDVSDQKKAESELDRNRRTLEINNEKYQIIMNQIGCIIFEYDHGDATITFNRIFRNTFGYTPPKDFSVDFFFEKELLHPADRERFEKLADSLFKGAPSGKDVFRIANASGTFISCLVSATTIYDDYQTPIKTVGRIMVMEPNENLIPMLL